jgi:hypothetical protein
MKNRFELILLGFAAVGFFMWLSAKTLSDDRIIVRALVVDTSGKPLAGTILTLTSSARTAQGVTSLNGCVALTVRAGSASKWNLKVERSGYKSLDAELAAPHAYRWTIRLPYTTSAIASRLEPPDPRCP